MIIGTNLRMSVFRFCWVWKDNDNRKNYVDKYDENFNCWLTLEWVCVDSAGFESWPCPSLPRGCCRGTNAPGCNYGHGSDDGDGDDDDSNDE